MLITRTKGFYWFMVVVMLLGAISVNFSTAAYAAVSSDGIREVPTAGGFKLPLMEGKFSEPQQVAVDPSGHVYVADSGNHRIQKFNSSGTYDTQWGSEGSGNGEFDTPAGIAVDPSGNVYVVDIRNHRIQKFNSSGTYDTQWGREGSGNGEFEYPQGIAIDISGHVYVVDAGNQRIQKFNSSGTYDTQWGSEGSGDGEFNNPQGIAVDTSGNVYVVDAGNQRIQKFDSSGTYDTQWGSEGRGEGEFSYPNGIAVDTSGNVYVADAGNHRIQKFDSSGTYVTQLGSEGSRNGYFNTPPGVAVDTNGNVYVVDAGNHRIQKLDSNREYVTQWGEFGRTFFTPMSIATDSNGNVYVADIDNHAIRKFDSNGTYVMQIGKPGSRNGEFSFPAGVVVDASGNVYVVDSGNDRIQKFDSSGTYIRKWDGAGNGNGEFMNPRELVIDTNGSMYVTDSRNNRIQKFDSSGVYVTQWGSEGSGDGEFKSPEGIAVDTSGNVYVADSRNHRIQKFDSSGTYVTQWGSFGSGNGEFSMPVGVAVDPSGNVYVVDRGNQRIQKFDSSGTYVTQWGSSNPGDVQFNHLNGVMLDNSGNLYVMEITPTNGGQVRKFISNNNVHMNRLTLMEGTLSPSFIPDRTSYTASVAASVTAGTITTMLEDPMATVDVSGASGTVTGVVYNNVASFSVPLNVGENRITVTVKAMDETTTKNYTVTVTRGQAPYSGGGGGGSITPVTSSDDEVTSKDGKLTLPVGRTGVVSLGDELTITIPANATDKELKVTIEKMVGMHNLMTNQGVLISPIFEIMKNFPENFNKPVTLTFLFDPASLKSDQKASVFYYDEEKKSWVEVGGTVNGNHISVEVNHFGIYTVLAVGQAPEVSFSDISGHWAEANIKQALSNGIVSGYQDDTFKPNSTVTRAEFAVMLMNTLKSQGEGAELTFTDTAKIGAWAQKAVAQAVHAGIIKGYGDGTFRSDAGITRSEMAMMIVNALGQPIDEATTTGFVDDKAIPKWAQSAVAAMKKLGIITGKGMNKFAPDDHATRAEAVTVLLKILAHKNK
jgi:tripartite motif-containing protein 71